MQARWKTVTMAREIAFSVAEYRGRVGRVQQALRQQVLTS